MYTPQSAFDKMVTHLLSMKERSTVIENDYTYCVYRGPNNSMCVFGVMIPDELYLPDFDEDRKPADTVFSFPQIKELFDPTYNDWVIFLEDMQNTHDDQNNWNENGFCDIEALREIAITYNLKTDCITR